MKMIYHVSGHLDLTPDEFSVHYLPALDALRAGEPCAFVVGDAVGADAMFIEYAATHQLDVTVYHMFEAPRRTAPGAPTVGGYTSDEARDAAMTAASDADIAWVRPGRERSGTAKNLKRRATQGLNHAGK